MKRFLAIGFVVAFLNCVGSGVDSSYRRSDCPWQSDHNFYSEGYDMVHEQPSHCPLPIVVSSPWFATPVNYSAFVLGGAESYYVTTQFYNANNAYLQATSAVFQEFGGRMRADLSDTYPAASVPVRRGERSTDYAYTYPTPGIGTATVDLTYEGTSLSAVVQGSAVQGDIVQLSAYPQGNDLVEPITYQWYQNGSPLGEPTQNNSIDVQFSDLGTIWLLVIATDVNGQTANAKGWIFIEEPCGPNAC